MPAAFRAQASLGLKPFGQQAANLAHSAMSDKRYFENGKPCDVSAFGGGAGASVVKWSDTLGPALVTSAGQVPTDEALQGKKKVALLFAGQWCPYCRAFEPLMRDIYQKVKGADPNDTEIVYLSTDENDEKFGEYASAMPWSAMPFNKAQGNGEPPLAYVRKKVIEATGKPQGILGAKYGVKSVPTVVVLDGRTGEIVNEDFTEEVTGEPEDGFRMSPKAPPTWLEALER